MQQSETGDRRRQPQERERSRVPVMERTMERRIEVDVSMHAPVPQTASPPPAIEDEMDNLEWARSKQQREIEARVNRTFFQRACENGL